MPVPKKLSRYERGKENVQGKVKIPWKNPLQGHGSTDFAFVKVSVRNKGVNVGFRFTF